MNFEESNKKIKKTHLIWLFLAPFVGYFFSEFPDNEITSRLPEVFRLGIFLIPGILYGFFIPNYWVISAILLSIYLYILIVVGIITQSNLGPIAAILSGVGSLLFFFGSFLGKTIRQRL